MTRLFIRTTLLAVLTFTVFVTSCRHTTSTVPTATDHRDSGLPADQLISSEVSHGLHMIKINDTLTVLLYRGVESCTMIQIK